MTKPHAWDRMMTDVEFVAVSLAYFKKRFWSLHEGCCLIAKVDPSTHAGVGLDYENWSEDDQPDDGYDYTRRPFVAALRSIKAQSECELLPNDRPKLNAHHIEQPMVGAKSILLDMPTFIRWALDRWPDQTEHFKLAWDARQTRKAASEDAYLSGKEKNKPSKAEQAQKSAYLALINELGEKVKSTSDRELAKILETRTEATNFAGKTETLRKKIPQWRKEISG